MTILLRQRIDRIKHELLADKKTGEIITRFTAEWDTSTRSMERAICHAKVELQEENKREEELLNTIRQKDAIRREEDHLRNEEDIDNMLMDIVRGAARVKKMFYNQGVWEQREIGPTLNERIRAAEEYRKRVSERKEDDEMEKKKRKDSFVGYANKSIEAFQLEELEIDLGGTESIDNCQLTMNNDCLPVGKENKEVTEQPLMQVCLPDMQEKKRVDPRPPASFYETRDYASLTDEQVDWMMRKTINGARPNLPIAESEEEVDRMQKMIEKWKTRTAKKTEVQK